MADDGGTSDSGTTDAGFATASHPRLPLVLDQGGLKITAPRVTSVTFASTYAAPVADRDVFVDGIGKQPYWAAIASEYGVGAPIVEPPQHLAEAAPATIADADIKTWLANEIQSGVPGFADASASSIFVLFYPSTTTISQPPSMKSCVDFGAYHGSAQATVNGQPVLVAYAVIPECVGSGAFSTLDDVTWSASHELVEACTDPYTDRNGSPPYGYIGTGPANSTSDPYAAWSFGVFGSYGTMELADMCNAEFTGSVYWPPGFPYVVQRSWSNAAVKAGKDPCAPYLQGESVYFLAQPVFDPDFAVHEAMNPPQYMPSVSFTTQGTTLTTQGLKIPVGSSATIPLILWSDAPKAHPWTVTVDDPAVAIGSQSPHLSFSQDATMGNNGDVIHVTIHVKSANATSGGEVFRVTSTDGVLKHSVFGFVGN